MSRKSDYICLCLSYRCSDKFVTLPSGEKQPGKLVSRATLNNHCKADEALYDGTKSEGSTSTGKLQLH